MLNKIFESIINFTFIFIILYLLIFQNISNFIHPRMIPYLITTAIVLVIFLIINILKQKSTHEEKLHPTVLIYFLPILALLFINDGNISNNLINNKGVLIGSSTSNSSTAKIDKEDIPPIEDNKTGADIIINDYKYSYMLDRISNNIDDFYGDTIEIKGFILKDEDLMAINQFMIARLYMVCCIADVQTIGYLCEYDNVLNKFKENSWVRIVAKIDKTDYEEKTVPYLKVLCIESIKKPLDQYVY